MGDALTGRVVLITGSSRGIGAEVAVKAAAEGATVGIHYLTGAAEAARTLERVREAPLLGRLGGPSVDLRHGRLLSARSG